jgi:hypothetical protein
MTSAGDLFISIGEGYDGDFADICFILPVNQKILELMNKFTGSWLKIEDLNKRNLVLSSGHKGFGCYTQLETDTEFVTEKFNFRKTHRS